MRLQHKIKSRLGNVSQRLLPKDNIGKSLKNFQKTVSIDGLSRSDDFEDKIEIIIPCYNHAQYLGDAYQSIVSQTWKDRPITITFIDDNSADSTKNIVQSIQKQKTNNNIRYIRNEQNIRQQGSINKAVTCSNSEIFVILNDDDLLVPDALDVIVATFRLHPELALVGASSIWFDNKKPVHKVLPQKELSLTIYTPEDAKKYRSLNDLNMTHSSSAFLRYAWEAVGGYRDKADRISQGANEDRDFQMRVSSLFPVGVYQSYPLAYWRTSSSHGKDF